MRSAGALSAVVALTVAMALPAADVVAAARRQHAARRGPTTLDVPAQTRLLVVAPHPDDETLGAGGLMERVHESGGHVNVEVDVIARYVERSMERSGR